MIATLEKEINCRDRKISEVHEVLKYLSQDFFEANPTIYWSDFLASALVGWSSFLILGIISQFSINFWLLSIISIFSLYRALSFIHEICHQSKNKKFINSFRLVWHALIGIFFFFPSTFYDCHHEHHNPKNFKTHRDPQYSALKGNPVAILKLTLFRPIISPFILAIRFLLLTPISFFYQPLQNFIYTHLSAAAELGYVSTFNSQQKKLLNRVEIAIAIAWSIIITLLTYRIIPVRYLFLYYFLAVFVGILNFVRVLGEHRLDELSYHSLTLEEQFLDSFNYERGSFLQLLYVTGLRYHALHHLCPAIPYHNLAKVHQYLKVNLPQNSIYHRTDANGHWHNLRKLFRNDRL